jgi:hypothetical protein
MGHKTVSATIDYAHTSSEAMRREVERLRKLPARVVEFRAAGQGVHHLAILAADVIRQK